MSTALRIGLTGGIGSGKTEASHAFARLGATIIDTDLIARELVEPGRPALAEIVAAFGPAVLDGAGRLNRARLRDRIFSDADARRRLEEILHPRIRDAMLARAERTTAPYVIFVIPLLFETGQQGLVDRVLLIDAPEAMQRRRVAVRDAVVPWVTEMCRGMAEFAAREAGRDIPIGTAVPPLRPSRPARPELLDPREVPKRKPGSPQGRIALLHAVAHIELNAVDLHWDIIARFGHVPMPAGFYDDWVKAADEESKHFNLVSDCLERLGSAYGELPAHAGMWRAAEDTAEDLLGRLAGDRGRRGGRDDRQPGRAGERQHQPGGGPGQRRHQHGRRQERHRDHHELDEQTASIAVARWRRSATFSFRR